MTSTFSVSGRSCNLSRVCEFYCVQTINLLFTLADEGGGSHKIGHFCGLHKCMTP